jgi:hypothetical protein
MSAQREKFQVWSDTHQQWRTAYVRVTMLYANLTMMKAHGFKVRVGGPS